MLDSTQATGEMARRVRAYDWAATPLGPFELWTPILKATVDLMLASGHAMQLAWGPQRTVLYNDAYAPMLGNRHPAALGMPFQAAWPDIWDDIEPLVARVFGGETVRFENLPLTTTRHGYPEATWWNFSYSPVRDETGAVAGLLNVTMDTTPRVRAERAEYESDDANAQIRESEKRQRFLLELSDTLRPLADAAEIQATTTRLVGMHLAADRVMYAEVDGERGAEAGTIRGQYVRAAGDSYPPSVPFPQRFTFGQFGAHTMEARYRGDLLIVDDIDNDARFDRAERIAWRRAGLRAAIVAPLAKGGRLVAEFGVHSTSPRAWTDAEVTLIRDVAERTWSAAERARAEAALRESEMRFRAMVTAGSFSVYRMSPDWRFMYQLDSQTLARTSGAIENWASKYILPDDLPAVTAAVEEAIRSKTLFELEHRVRRADGGIVWLLSRAVPSLGPDGEILEWFGTGTDVTERKQAEARLAVELADTQALHRISSRLIVGDDIDALYAAIVDVARSLMRSDMASLQRLVPERQELLLLAQHGLAPESAAFWEWVGAANTTSCGVTLAYGEPVIVRDVETWDLVAGTQDLDHYRLSRIRSMLSSPLISRDGRLVGVMSTHWHEVHEPSDRDLRLFDLLSRQAADLIEKSAAEAALRESERRYHALFAASPVPFMVLAPNPPDFTITAANDAYLAATLTTREGIVGRPLFDVFTDDPGRAGPKGPEALGVSLGRVLSTRRPDAMPRTRYDILTPQGQFERRWWMAINAPLLDAEGRVSAIIHQVTNETELQLAEAAERETQERLRQFGEASQDVLWIREAESLQWVYLTPAFEAIYGLSREEALTGDNYRAWHDLIVPEDRDAAMASISRVYSGEHMTYEFRIRRPVDGQIRWMRNTDFPIMNAAGKITLIGGIGHDMTEVKLFQAELERSKERLSSAVGVARLGLWDWNVLTGETHWSDEHYRMEGYMLGEVTPSYKVWLARVHPDDRDGAEAALRQAMDQHTDYTREFRVVHPDGSVHWLSSRGRFFYDDAKPVRMVGAMMEVTERREWEERQTVLVAELQHRTRNLMGVVRSTADKTARASADLPDFRARFRDRLDALARVQGLLSRLNEHDRVTFDELIHTELAAMDGAADRVTLQGPLGIRLRSSTVQTLAMGLHELATNSLKYGALGQTTGYLDITWSLEPAGDGQQPWLSIDWREHGVVMPPAKMAPQGSGQGRELIERALPYQLNARTSYVLGPDGVHCTISIPVSATTNTFEVENA